MTFPKGFLWGVATSSHQIEGADVDSDWWDWEEKGRVGNGARSGEACDSWDKWRKDNEWIERLGLNCYRFSVSWARIEPREGSWNREAVEHYKEMMRDLRRRKIKTMLCLNHCVNPLWFSKKGGWEKSRNIDYFLRFVKRLAGEVGAGVDYWITFNEPVTTVAPGYVLGVWPPFRKNLWLAKRAMDNLVTAHKLVYRILHEIKSSARVGVVMAMMKYEAEGWGTGMLAKYLDRTVNHDFLDRVRDELDWVGVNYYSRIRLIWDLKWLWKMMTGRVGDLKLPGHGGWRSKVMGLEIYPEGLRWAIEAVEEMKKPIFVSENGYEDTNDRLRRKFIKEHLRVLKLCLEEGKDVRGYFYWTLMDNFEWTFGYGPKFGLLTRDRKPKGSAWMLKRVAESNSM